MAVPSSGQISMLGLARELANDDYTDTTAITSPISMYNLINGGNTGGGQNSGVSYDTINTSSTVHPHDGTFVLLTTLNVNFGGNAPGSCSTNLVLHNSSSLNSAVTVYIRNDGRWFDVKNTGTMGEVLNHYWERLTNHNQPNTAFGGGLGHVYYTNSSGSTRLANGTYYMSFNGANSNGVYTCLGPGNETLKLKVTVSNDGVKHENAAGG